MGSLGEGGLECGGEERGKVEEGGRGDREEEGGGLGGGKEEGHGAGCGGEVKGFGGRRVGFRTKRRGEQPMKLITGC